MYLLKEFFATDDRPPVADTDTFNSAIAALTVLPLPPQLPSFDMDIWVPLFVPSTAGRPSVILLESLVYRLPFGLAAWLSGNGVGRIYFGM